MERAIGCCIFQNKKPIHYASRCLSDNKINYSQVEKEMVAIVFGCTKFHYLIYGQDRMKVNTDHQPLVPIMKKEIHKMGNALGATTRHNYHIIIYDHMGSRHVFFLNLFTLHTYCCLVAKEDLKVLAQKEYFVPLLLVSDYLFPSC